MLSLPYAMFLAGPLLALQILFLFAFLSFYAAQTIVQAGRVAKQSSYPNIIRYFFGPIPAVFSQVLLSVALVVAAISYIVGLVDLLPALLPIHLPRTPLTLLTLFLLFPATLVTNLSTFAPFSFLATFGCYLQAAALLLQLFLDKTWTLPPASEWLRQHPKGLLQAFPLISFVYAFHHVLTDNLTEFHNPTPRRITYLNLFTILTTILCYIPVSIAGFLLHSGRNLSTNLLTGLSPTSVTVLVANISIASLLLLTYPLFLIPLRRKFHYMLHDMFPSICSNLLNVVIATTLNVFVAVFAISLRNLGLANALAGGCIALIMFYFPGRLLLRMQIDTAPEQRDYFRIVIAVVFIALGVVICISGLFGQLLFSK